MPLYDTIRSEDPGNFMTGATCVESNDGLDTTSSDPSTESNFFYLIRAENACGAGRSGTDGNSVERDAQDCP